MNNLKYPVKYAVLELKNEGDIYAYIVSKCYLTYKDDLGYHVLFPLKDLNKYKQLVNEWHPEKNLLKFGEIDMDDLDVVYKVFDNFDEAKEMARSMNIRFRYKVLSNILWEHGEYSHQLMDTYRKLNEQLNTAKRMEIYIFLHTSDMKVSKDNSKKLKR